jgi:hypothetical protein
MTAIFNSKLTLTQIASLNNIFSGPLPSAPPRSGLNLGIGIGL